MCVIRSQIRFCLENGVDLGLLLAEGVNLGLWLEEGVNLGL